MENGHQERFLVLGNIYFMSQTFYSHWCPNLILNFIVWVQYKPKIAKLVSLSFTHSLCFHSGELFFLTIKKEVHWFLCTDIQCYRLTLSQLDWLETGCFAKTAIPGTYLILHFVACTESAGTRWWSKNRHKFN